MWETLFYLQSLEIGIAVKHEKRRRFCDGADHFLSNKLHYVAQIAILPTRMRKYHIRQIKKRKEQKNNSV